MRTVLKDILVYSVKGSVVALQAHVDPGSTNRWLQWWRDDLGRWHKVVAHEFRRPDRLKLRCAPDFSSAHRYVQSR